MSGEMNRRSFIKGPLLGSVAVAAGVAVSNGRAFAQTEAAEPNSAKAEAAPKAELPKGKIGNLSVSRVLLGGNLLTHYTHSRDLKYVYGLAKHYNTEEKILETLALAESYGIDTLSIHTVPWSLDILKKHRKRGGKIKWIICPTAEVTEGMNEYAEQVRKLVDDGTDAIYLWGVRADGLCRERKINLVAKAVEIVKDYGLLSGVGGHDLNVVKMCEKNKIPADFYIKTMHHHNYPTGPKKNELKKPYSEYPGYWCKNPKEVIAFMKKVEKPWIAFKVMAAGAIPPKDAFRYVFENGADHILAGMFDFEIEEDVRIANEALAKINPSTALPSTSLPSATLGTGRAGGTRRTRPWRS